VNESKANSHSLAFYYVLLLFVVPFIVLSIPGLPHWMGRVIGISIFIFFMTIGSFWYGLSPTTVMIRPGAKLARPEFDSIRPHIERGMRATVIIFAVFFLVVVTRPFTMDLIQLARGGKPVEITARPVAKQVPLFGIWFVEQSVRFVRGDKDYSLFYSSQPLRVGEEYEFIVLPRSRLILDFRESGG
jgi:hypothetical protein